MQATGAQPHPAIRAPDAAPVHYERHGPEQTTLYRLVQQHAATFITQAEDAAGADLPRFVKDEFDAFLECGSLAHGKALGTLMHLGPGRPRLQRIPGDEWLMLKPGANGVALRGTTSSAKGDARVLSPPG